MRPILSFFTIAFSLFILMDPIGNIPMFIAVLKEIDPKRQRKIIFRELLIALAIIFLFYFIGNFLLQLLGVSQASVLIGGGIILFLIALKMVFPTRKEFEVDLPEAEEPFIVPLAVPFVAGPAVLAAVMLYSQQRYPVFLVMGAVTAAWIVSTIILLASSFLKNLLGWRGILACERLMGLLLVLIAVEMFLQGLRF